MKVVVRGESGRNELLRGPFALFGVRSSAKLVRDLSKHRRTPMSPPQLIPPTSPGQVFAGDGRLRRRFSRHRTRSVPGAACGGVLTRLMQITQRSTGRIIPDGTDKPSLPDRGSPRSEFCGYPESYPPGPLFPEKDSFPYTRRFPPSPL